jgi:acyl-CoA reductase LuxC
VSTDWLTGKQRVVALLAALERAILPASAQRAQLVARLQETSGLSRAGIEWALEHCLERAPSERELDALAASVDRAPDSARAHVILPSNVFVAAHRAVALALAASPRVCVKPSRREPALIEALHAQAPELFELVAELDVSAGDAVYAYGSDVTLEALRQTLPEGAVLHAHGSGFGIAVVDLEALADAGAARAAAHEIARDTACFDQRGCLSPRFVLALGEAPHAERFGQELAVAMAEIEALIPLGRLDADELAEAAWYRQCAACFGRVLPAGRGRVCVRDGADLGSLAGAAPFEVPPVGRHLEVIAITLLEPALQAFHPWLTSVGCASPALEQRVRRCLGRARVAPLGQMQRPPFDGPVDRRSDCRGELIRR